MCVVDIKADHLDDWQDYFHISFPLSLSTMHISTAQQHLSVSSTSTHHCSKRKKPSTQQHHRHRQGGRGRQHKTSMHTSSSENDSSSSSSSTSGDDDDELFLLTPPPSPPASPQLLSSKDETRVADERLLAAKRQGQLRAVMNEFAAIKRQGYVLSERTYSIVLDAHTTLRREGSPMTHMLQGKNLFNDGCIYHTW